MKQWYLWGVVLLYSLFLPGASTRAQTAPPQVVENNTVLVVGLYASPPFAIKEGEEWDGISVHLWREVAHALEIDNYRLQEIERAQMASLLQQGRVDVVISALVTAQDEAQVDFTHSYYTTPLGLATPQQRRLLEIIGAVFSPRFIRIGLWLSLILATVGVLIWLSERRQNASMFGGGAARGIGSGFWWAAVTMSTIGYGDKVPHTVPGRTLALLWMVLAMAITSSLTAQITTVLSTQGNLLAIQVPQDLRTMKVGVVEQSVSADYLAEERIQTQGYADPKQGLEALSEGQIEVFVHNRASLRHINQATFQSRLRIQSTERLPQRYAFAIPEDSPLREMLNQEILRRTYSSAWSSLIDRYLSQ